MNISLLTKLFGNKYPLCFILGMVQVLCLFFDPANSFCQAFLLNYLHYVWYAPTAPWIKINTNGLTNLYNVKALVIRESQDNLDHFQRVNNKLHRHQPQPMK